MSIWEFIPGGKVTGSSLISAVAQVGLQVPTPRAEEVLLVHLRVPSLGSRRLHCTGSEAHLVHGHCGYAGLRDRCFFVLFFGGGGGVWVWVWVGVWVSVCVSVCVCVGGCVGECVCV